MKLTIQRAALNVALAQAARVVERRNTIPILSNVRLEADGNGLMLTATDLDIEARIRAEATVEVPGNTTVPAGLFSGLAAKLPDGPVTLTLDDAGSQVAVQAGRMRAKLNALPAGDFPDIGAGEMSHVFTLTPGTLIDAIEATSFAISTEEIRYYLNGLFWHATDEHLVVVATDGHRLSRWRGPLPDGAAGLPGVIVPRKAVAEIAKIAAEGAKAGHDLMTVALSDGKIRVEIGPTVLTSKLIDGTFPDYGRVIPQKWENEVTLERAVTVAAIDRVTSISNERGRAVRLEFRPGALALSVVNPDAGDAREEIAVSGEATIDIGFNGRYIADVLAACGSDTVSVKLGDAGSPTVFEPIGRTGPDRLIVLMPMRV